MSHANALLVLPFLLTLAGASYPLTPLSASPQCICSDHDGVGWNHLLNRCMEGSVTSCLECPTLSKCAKVSNIAGDGIQLFWGDCRSSSQVCAPADKSSIAFATSLAIDELDNIYFSDQGNNRIRMLDNSKNALVTLAGTGEPGFQGDGGPARDAQLRRPEGLALKPGLTLGADSAGRELYFADFSNQRIRKLVRQASHWVIYTVAGNGVMGDDPLCDSGCPALETSLSNPRSLAFASNQDLYFVDSGSHKIRRLTTGLGDPASNTNATVSTFMGHSGWLWNYGMWQSWRGIAKVMLPGHFESPNADVHMRAIYAVTIDKDDRLWTIDSDNNRIFMAPLVNTTTVQLVGDFGNFFPRLAASMFTDSSTQLNATLEDRYSSQLTWADNLKTWLPLEFPGSVAAGSVQVQSTASPYRPGFSYWRYGAPVAHETWCPKRQVTKPDKTCGDISAQMARFNGLMGMCLDHTGGMYLVDMEDSQIVFLDSDTFSDAKEGPTGEQAVTADGCECVQYWVSLDDIEPEWYLPGSLVSPEYENDATSCRENPNNPYLQTQLDSSTNPAQFNVTEALAETPKCSTTNYCARVFTDTYPKWCYVNARRMPEGQLRDTCMENRWLWCDADVQEHVEISWRFVPGATIIGHEKRFETRYLLSLADIQALQRPGALTSDLWLTSGTPYRLTGPTTSRAAPFFLSGTAILKGFVDFGRGVDNCGSHCCGLPTLSDFQVEGRSGFVCGLLSMANLSVLESYYPQNQTAGAINKMLTVWSELESLVVDATESAGVPTSRSATNIMEFCKSRCQYDATCSGFLVKGVDTDSPQPLSSGQPCIFFSQNYPFYVYTIDRTVAPFDQLLEVNLSNPVDRATALNSFAGPGVPASRLIADQDGIYVASESSLVHSKDTIGGSNMNKALLLLDCQELCLQDPQCTGIAFPGCYLLQKENIQMLSQSEMTSVFVKEETQPSVKPVAGYHEADSYANETPRAIEAYLNKPFSCTVDSKGDLIFSDGNNQRIRKIHGYNSDCSTSGHFSPWQVQEFELHVAAADAACNNESAPQLSAIYASAQAEVIENRSVQLVQEHFCNFGSSPKLADMASYTNNVFVLCFACQDLNPRPDACPWPELCLCRSAVMEVATTFVHIHCPQRNAFVDPWHRWVTAMTSCLLEDPQAAGWYNSSTTPQLQQHLQTV